MGTGWNLSIDKENATISKTRTIEASNSIARLDGGLATVISKTNRDASGQQIDMQMRNRIGRWRTWNNRSQLRYHKDRNLSKAFMQIQILIDKLSLPYLVIEKTTYIYRKIQQRGLIRGIPIKFAVIAALYIAFRELEIPRTLKELAEISNTDEKNLSRFYRNAILELDIKVPQVDVTKIIVKIANICKASEKSKREALKLVYEIVKRKIFASKDPMGLAGAIIYLVCKRNEEKITLYQIANATGVTLVTLSKNLRFLEDYLK
jgi:transcription initiation factor TFIIB